MDFTRDAASIFLAMALAGGLSGAGANALANPEAPSPCKEQLAQLSAEIFSSEQGANGAALGAASFDAQARDARAAAAGLRSAGDEDGAQRNEAAALWMDRQAADMRMAMMGFQRAASAAAASRSALAKHCR